MILSCCRTGGLDFGLILPPPNVPCPPLMWTVGFCGVRKIRAAPPVISRKTPPPVISWAKVLIPKGSVKNRTRAVPNNQTRGFLITKSPQRQITTHSARLHKTGTRTTLFLQGFCRFPTEDRRPGGQWVKRLR